MQDPRRYGRSFADVYDSWYPGGDEDAVVAHLGRFLAPGSAVLELGAGTGRLAIPLADAGFEVTGMDSSEEMLSRLVAKAGTSVNVVLGDVAEPTDWPPGPFTAVLAACNLLLNLTDPAAQRSCIEKSAEVLTPGGVLMVEQQRLELPVDASPKLEVRSAREDLVVLIATQADPATGIVTGNHVELRDGEPVRLRPWSIRSVELDELDTWCTEAGLGLIERCADHHGAPDDGSSATTVSLYRRSI